MIKVTFLFITLVSWLSSNVLILGESSSKFKCDDIVMSPVAIKNCKKIEAIDDINICYISKLSLGCKKIFGKESYTLDDIESNPINFKRLFSFSENQKTSFGIKRFSKEMKDIGIPIGSIIKPNEDIKIELGKDYSIELILEDDKSKIIEKKKFVDSAIVLNSKYFQYSKVYKVMAKIDGVQYEGSFDIMTKESEMDMEAEINNLLKNIEDENSKKIIKSIVYDQYGLNYNRELILKEVSR
ncbi:MAG: hypothetical protein PHI38_02550 [Sulfurimonas sp.]|jgi:hypothetical protein|uniref:hypothetical protein n=1 Tax=Sulfurimonas sp. TaxID=2022749 RepID=UPI0026320BCE|nr:hypothetical protein [Sulfurimonas sp.]MDD3475726.1 hypothetical protein [Sulfurimonas sp.]